ncbi:TPA: hypothetical protein ACH3X2_011787 [Trebouxia sp. C0005]
MQSKTSPLCSSCIDVGQRGAGGLPSGSEGEAAMPSAALPPSPATAALPAAAAATQPPATAAAQPLSPTAVQSAADADAAAAAVAVPAGATNAPVPARAVAATRSVAATRRATAAPQPHPLQVSQLQPVEVLQLLQSARQNAATALLPPAPRAMAMVTRSSGGASLNTDLSLYQTAIQFRLHLVSHGYVSCKPDGDCGFNAASQLQCRSSHLSCSIDNLTGVGQGQQQDVRQLAANVLRTNTSLQKALCHPEVGTDVFDTWKALLPARIGQDGVC